LNGCAAIDLSPFVSEGLESQKEQVAQAWDLSFRKVGFAVITGHGLSMELQEEIRASMRRFFNREDAYKAQFAKEAQASAGARSGYSAVGKAMGMAAEEADPLEGYTYFPTSYAAHPAELTAAIEKYYAEITRVMQAIHRLSAKALGLTPDFFEPFYQNPANCFVMSHYPPLVAPLKVREGKLRYRAHSDYTGFTLLLQDPADNQGDSGGLECDVQGRWVPVRATPGALVINIGDLFQTWTNDRWRSTPHRVTSPPLASLSARRSRYSVMLFSGPNLESVIEPIETCIERGRAARHATLTAREHLLQMHLTKSKEANYKPG
jgi:isopenicillin N synthase-like dioxygenase